MGKVMRFFEYDKVSYNAFNSAQVSALRRLHTITDGLYYTLGDNSFTFKEHVGVIQINELTIEILPKVDREDDDKGKWHDILLHMLKECRFMDPQSSGYANLKLHANSVMELYFEKYVYELEMLLHYGLIKKYRTEEGNQYALRGRLMFGRHISENLSHAERFYVEYDQYDNRHILHQVLRQALEIICKLAAPGPLTERMEQVKSRWPESKSLPVSEGLFGRFSINRKTQPYREALLIAKMILLNFHPDLRGGQESVLALMFNMNNLWEEFMFRRFKILEKPFNWKITEKTGFKYWTGASGSKKLIPDILIECRNGKKIIVDTKWKRPAKNKPDDHDLRQLLSYKLYYQSDTAYLLYPCYHVDSHIVDGSYHDHTYRFKLPVFRETLGLDAGLMFFNILNGKRLVSKADFVETAKKLFHNTIDN